MQEGFILINKPEGWTSFDVVGFLRNKIREQNPGLKKIKVGHAGTLDPFATGLLIVGIGRTATRNIDHFKNLPKTYIAKLRLAATSTTEDKTGIITEIPNTPKPAIEEVQKTVTGLIGKSEQTPPMFSAKQMNGVRLYKLARRGEEVERKTVPIEIYDAKLLEYAYPYISFEVKCSAGTYVRTICKTIGEKLGPRAYCEELTRTAIGPYTLNQAKTPEQAFLSELHGLKT